MVAKVASSTKEKIQNAFKIRDHAVSCRCASERGGVKRSFRARERGRCGEMRAMRVMLG
jgi:hypothetical protein